MAGGAGKVGGKAAAHVVGKAVAQAGVRKAAKVAVSKAGRTGAKEAAANVPKAAAATVPKVADNKLGNIVSDLFKGTKNPNRVGSGTTADAIRRELATQTPTAGRMHIQKGHQYVRALRNWLRKNPEASPQDRQVAQELLDDLNDALKGK